jgi:hypothetical protein
MDIITPVVSNYLLLVSFSMMAVELTFFIQFKKTVDKLDQESLLDEEVDDLVKIMKAVTLEHLMVYTGIYFTLVMVCRFVPAVYFLLLPLQAVSLILDMYVLWKLFRK